MATETFLVSGCAGFIGGHMLDRLLALDCDVVGVDDFSTGTRENLAPYRDKIRFIEGNVCDPAIAAEAVRGVDRVIHLASIPSVPRSIAEPRVSAESSIISTVTLMHAAAQAGVKRFVQASSSSVYGDVDLNPRREDQTPSPMSPYAAAKLTQELYAQVFWKCYGLDTASLRYFNVFGPRQDPNGAYAAVIPKFIVLMLAGKRPEIYGDGLHTRDFTYIANVVDANLRAATWPAPLQGAAMNIGAGGSFSLNELVADLNDILGTDLPPIYREPRAGDVLHSQADISLAAERIGYQPGVGFREGLRRTIDALRGEG